MCDDATEGENEAYLGGKQLSRREVGVGAGATLALLMAGCKETPAPANEPASAHPTETTEKSAAPQPTVGSAAPLAVTGRMVSIQMPEGTAEAFFVAPQG